MSAFYEIDLAFISLILFTAFFIGLVFYLRREDRREGYPLEQDGSGIRDSTGAFIFVPGPKEFHLPFDRGTVTSPDFSRRERDLPLKRVSVIPGSPSQPTTENPMLAGVGPGSYATRAKEPDLDHNGKPKLAPMRIATDFFVDSKDSDPRNMRVFGTDGHAAGTVTDIWVDRPESLVRYLEITLDDGETKVLAPISQVVIDGGRNKVVVDAIGSMHFADVPQLSNPDQITADEEERICAYYGGGYLYANSFRTEPLV